MARSALFTRLERLENATKPHGLACLARQNGEAREACVRRHGYDPLARGGMTFVLLDDADQRA